MEAEDLKNSVSARFRLRTQPVDATHSTRVKLLGKYGSSLRDVMNILDPQTVCRAPATESNVGIRKARLVKIHINPTAGKSQKPKAVITKFSKNGKLSTAPRPLSPG